MLRTFGWSPREGASLAKAIMFSSMLQRRPGAADGRRDADGWTDATACQRTRLERPDYLLGAGDVLGDGVGGVSVEAVAVAVIAHGGLGIGVPREVLDVA